uniref:type IV pilus assembly protein FimV n=1 Tax=Ottowia beijingensis TaxID=1207057 RepID=UPI00214DE590|nr:hypothetical protein [Ottowia beijingensis]
MAKQPWKRGVLASAVALTMFGVSLDAQALALGAITVRSALGEPLRAEIEVPQISSEEAATFQAAVASPKPSVPPASIIRLRSAAPASRCTAVPTARPICAWLATAR